MVKNTIPHKINFKKIGFRILVFNLLLLVLCVLSFVVCDHIYPLCVNIPYSQTIYDHKGEPLHVFLSKDQKWRLKASNEEISPLLKKVFLEKEDQYFYHHYGFNILSIARAVFNNILQQRKTSGASTITMQVSRLLEPKSRTYGHKIVEIFRAIQLENQFEKDEILNMYFNLIPYGGNVEGIKSISLLYLQKNVQKLTLAEAVALAIIPNRPSSLNIKKNHELIIKERNKWILWFKDHGSYAPKDISDALKEPFAPRYKPLPYRIPHLAVRLRKENPMNTAIHTYIHQETQYRTQEILNNYVKNLRKFNIYNAAALVIDNRNHNVVAYVGSNDFFDNDHAGQCDGVAAIRSPGSTFKPLLYALALDKGQLTFQSAVEDIPCDIKGYAPENFDKKYRGKISVETALLYSLNIPAVQVVDAFEVRKFVDKLVDVNFKQVKKDREKLGHSVILGGCGATLEEISNMYAAFAFEGKYRTSQLIKCLDVPTCPKATYKQPYKDIQMVSPAAAFLTSQTLAKLSRPDIPNNAETIQNNLTMAWKTGTSYGKRDAWSIGYNPEYTVGIWLGNFDNSPVAELVGVELAAPLLFEVFQAIPQLRHTWFTQPPNLSRRIVCTESGLPPSEFCNSFANDLFIPGVSNNTPCEHLKEYSVSSNEKVSYCKNCVPELGYKKLLYPNLSADMIHYYDLNHIIYKKIPPHNPQCASSFTKQKITIVHPQKNKTYYTDETFAHIKLECSVDASVRYVYWYVNDKFIGKYAKNEEVFTKLKPQQAKISCTDDMGNTSHVVIDIQKM